MRNPPVNGGTDVDSRAGSIGGIGNVLDDVAPLAILAGLQLTGLELVPALHSTTRILRSE